jgi:LPXTG-motif cell wall-anchored protein
LVQTVQLTSTNGWIYTFEDLAPFDASGNAYQYRIAEDDSYYSLYSVTYSYVDANGNTTTAQGSPDYTMTLDGNTYDYGSLTITNMSLVNNLLPSTGGIGTTVFRIIGGLLVLAAIAFFIMKRSKKS